MFEASTVCTTTNLEKVTFCSTSSQSFWASNYESQNAPACKFNTSATSYGFGEPAILSGISVISTVQIEPAILSGISVISTVQIENLRYSYFYFPTVDFVAPVILYINCCFVAIIDGHHAFLADCHYGE